MVVECSGLSVSQWLDLAEQGGSARVREEMQRRSVFVYGDSENIVNRTNPVFNITSDKLKYAIEFFHQDVMPSIHEELLVLGN